MKTTFRYLAAAFTVIAAVSCAKHEELGPQEENQVSTYQYILNVSHENDDTKTTMDGVNILWNADDKIGVTGTKDGIYVNASVFGGEKSIVDVENYTPSSSAAFDLALPGEGYKPQAVVYPYFASAKITSGKSVNNGTICNVVVPATQIGVKGDIPVGALPMTGYITDNQCKMYNCGAIIKFELTREDITSLVFQGNNSEKIAGESYHYINVHKDDKVNKVGDLVKEKPIEGSSTVTLVPSKTVFEKGVYYFVVAPADLTGGFSITLTAQDGAKATRSTDARFNIERNHKYTNFGSDNWFRKIATGAAGDLGSAYGTTATLYAVVSGTDIAASDEYGFETSTNGETWEKYNGTVSLRTSALTSYNTLNVLTAPLTGLEPETTYYYRAYYTHHLTGVTTYCQAKSFKTYANAESAIINMYNGFDTGYWPFQNVAYDVDINKGTATAALHKGKDFDMTTTSGYAFTAKATGGVWLGNSNGCFTMSTSAGDYLKFPVIKGKKPIAVTMVIGGKNSKNQGLPSIGEFVEEGTTAVSAQWDGTSAAIYDSHTWNFTSTPDSQYGIHFNGKNNFYISYLEVVYVDAEIKPAKIEQNLLFCEGTGNHSNGATITQLWPFTGSHDSRPTWKEGDDFPSGPYFTLDHPELQYSFNVQTYDAEYWRHTRAGFIFGGTINDYMAFLPVENYRLAAVKIRGGAKATVYSMTNTSLEPVQATDASNNSVTTQQISSTYDSEIQFNLQNTSANTEYRLVLGSSGKTGVANIREMWITYELVK